MIPSMKFSLTIETWTGMTPKQVREHFNQAAEAMIERMRLEQAYREQYTQDITVEPERVDPTAGEYGVNRFGFYQTHFGDTAPAIVTAIGEPSDDVE